jgi:hypothetical protein
MRHHVAVVLRYRTSRLCGGRPVVAPIRLIASSGAESRLFAEELRYEFTAATALNKPGLSYDGLYLRRRQAGAMHPYAASVLE